MVARIETRPASQAEARRFREKAQEFAEAARSEFTAGRHNAAGLASIHAAITAADAATAHLAGEVSASKDHAQAAKLLSGVAGGVLSGQTKRQFLGLLRVKNEVEYEGKVLTEERARVMVDQAERFVRWCAEVAQLER